MRLRVRSYARGRQAALMFTAVLVAAATPGVATASPHRPVSPVAATHRILFDDSKAEQAGNADWVISTSMPDPLGQDSSPQSETDWTGAISSWGVALQKTGDYSLKTLPPGSTITYGGGGALDLSNFDEFVLPEPNVQLSAAEKTAIMTFVQNGGGLFLISDHNGSDRNNDGWDSPKVLNDLLTNNGVDNSDPFGFSVDVKNINTDDPVVTQGSNPIVDGAFGTVTGSILRSGTTFTMHPADNPDVSAAVWLSTANQSGTTDAFVVTSTFGSGRVAIWGDSSAIDDGTGASGENLFNGWQDPAGSDAEIGLNTTAWLASGSAGTGGGGGTELLANGGFENGNAAPWSGSARINNTAAEAPHAGTWDAWLDGYGAVHTDTLAQQVTIPAAATKASLSFWLKVDSAASTTTVFDTLKAQVLNGSGTVLSTLGTYSNVDQGTGYTKHSFDLSAYAGQTVTVRFTGTEDDQKATSFVIDDTSLTTS